MNWLAVGFLAYGAMGLQTGLSAFVRWGDSAPNFGLLALLFICINAKRELALPVCVLLGALQDLATQQPMGLFAFSYGLAAVAITRAAASVHREHPLTHFTCAILGGLVVAFVMMLNARLHRGVFTAGTPFAGVLYTALLAPLLIGLLQKIKPVFGFRK